MGLDEYNRKRDFRITREPAGEAPPPAVAEGARGFVIQKHAASRLHYDFRLALDGVLKSWSVPKGPSLDPKVKRLAMHVEDHPLAYADFEGIIPKGQYGGGTVLVWDRGSWEPLGDPHRDYAAGNLKFRLKGEKLRGGFALIRLRPRGRHRGDQARTNDGPDDRAWLLIKERDAEAHDEAAGDITADRPESVATGRTLDQIAADRERVWHSKTAHLDLAGVPGAKAAPFPTAIVPPAIADRPRPPPGPGWLHEIAAPGERLLALVERDRVVLLDGHGDPLSKAAASQKKAALDGVRMLPADTVVVDGVQEAAGVYFLFDLLYLDGHDLRGVPLERRKALLAELIRRASEAGPIRYLEHVAASGPAFSREAARLGIAAMVSRRADSRYAARAGWTRSPCATDARGAGLPASPRKVARRQDRRRAAPTAPAIKARP